VVLAYDYPFLDIVWTMFILSMLIIYVAVVIMALIDNFGRHDHSGFAKAGWTLFLIALPLIGVLTYMIARPPEGRARIA